MLYCMSSALILSFSKLVTFSSTGLPIIVTIHSARSWWTAAEFHNLSDAQPNSRHSSWILPYISSCTGVSVSVAVSLIFELFFDFIIFCNFVAPSAILCWHQHQQREGSVPLNPRPQHGLLTAASASHQKWAPRCTRLLYFDRRMPYNRISRQRDVCRIKHKLLFCVGD
jgi:hypothetical protein